MFETQAADPRAPRPVPDVRRIGARTAAYDIAAARRQNTHVIKLAPEEYDRDPPYLPVPGCLEVLAVTTTMGHEIAPIRRDKAPTDGTLANFTDLEYDTYWLEDHPTLGPVLCRHITSNDGFWQRGVNWYVTARWEGEPDPALADPDATDPTGAPAPVNPRRRGAVA